MCVSPLILRGEIDFSTFPRKGEGEKNKISLLTKKIGWRCKRRQKYGIISLTLGKV